jgi:hypothetical protein
LRAEVGIGEVLNPTDGAYTKSEMLRIAAAENLRATGALFDRWVTLGMLDSAKAEGRGYGRGVLRTWPEGQVQLWQTLLRQRERGVVRPRVLANVPVGLWLYWGEDYVPLRQVRRALETFAEVGSPAPRHDYRASARSLVRDFSAPTADHRAKEALLDALVDSAKSGKLDDDTIERLAVAVVGPEDRSQQADGPRLAGMLIAQFAARTEFASFQDYHFRWARAFYLFASEDYSRTRSELAADPRFGHIHGSYDFEHALNRACHDVLFILGLSLVVPPNPSLPEFLSLEAWRDGRAQLEVQTEIELSRLWLPSGQMAGGLGVQARFWTDPPLRPS